MEHYEVVDELGRGGFGIVEKVTDSSGQYLARKRFHPSPGINTSLHDGLRKRFRREVKVQSSLGGNEILPVLYSSLEGDAPWFVMPLADHSLYDRIQQGLKDREEIALTLADIMNAIEYLHDELHVHRDLNPRNVLYHDKHWKLSDLGAVLPPSDNTVTLTEDTIIFTERYCAPEQRNDFHAAQSSADIYSFGCILHDIFGTGDRTPYQQHSAVGAIGAIIEKCTDVSPERRPSMAQVRRHLLPELGKPDLTLCVDKEAEEWLIKLESVDDWDTDTLDAFVRYFGHLKTSERSDSQTGMYLSAFSTPMLTRLTERALSVLAAMDLGSAKAVIHKYCEWAGHSHFVFYFSDEIATRLATIYDVGDAATKAAALAALIQLGHSHNRWFVMRKALNRCSDQEMDSKLARRLALEIDVEECETRLRSCMNTLKWSESRLVAPIAELLA